MNSEMQTRRNFLKTIGGVGAALLMKPQLLALGSTGVEKKPNFIIIFVDDLGYGDLGCFGTLVQKLSQALDQEVIHLFFITGGY